MSNLFNLKSSKNKKPSRRLGRGAGSGKGKTSGRGHKGYKARTGSTSRLGYEGGQMPLLSRIPKLRGFKVHDPDKYNVLNVSELEALSEKGAIKKKNLKEKGVLKRGYKLKILGDGELKSALTVEADKFSGSAKEKIEKAGGKIIISGDKKVEK